MERPVSHRTITRLLVNHPPVGLHPEIDAFRFAPLGIPPGHFLFFFAASKTNNGYREYASSSSISCRIPLRIQVRYAADAIITALSVQNRTGGR